MFVAATSNTLPDKLGEGRFAAEDFLREIQSLSSKFDVVRVDGPDYRHRGLPEPPEPLSDEELTASANAWPGATLDDFDKLCDHLASLHPSRYGRLVDNVSAVHLRGVRPASDRLSRYDWWRSPTALDRAAGAGPGSSPGPSTRTCRGHRKNTCGQ